jgi:hypothetical protein
MEEQFCWFYIQLLLHGCKLLRPAPAGSTARISEPFLGKSSPKFDPPQEIRHDFSPLVHPGMG